MVSASELNPVIVKSEDVTEEEFAKVNEDLEELAGISPVLTGSGSILMMQRSAQFSVKYQQMMRDCLVNLLNITRHSGIHVTTE